MIRMELSDQEATILSQALRSELSDLRMEIVDTEDQPFRHQLKQKEDVLKHVLQSLAESGIDPEQSEPW